MARGWESKSVEAQQEEASRSQRPRPEPNPEDRTRAERRRSLELTRRRAVDDLSRATAPAHRSMLEQTIASIDEQLATLQ
jgi:hypothetical protein